jgi:alpha-L-rhamnosidase
MTMIDTTVCDFDAAAFYWKWWQDMRDNQQPQLCYKMATQQDYPSWNTLVRRGVQLETWDGGQAQMPSLGGPIGAWMFHVLAGIRTDPSGPGFKKSIIKPFVVGDLTWGRAHHDSPYGRISVEWKRNAGRLELNVTIAPNTTATVFIPATAGADVTEGSRPASLAEGVKFLRTEDGSAVYEVGSGMYRFACKR